MSEALRSAFPETTIDVSVTASPVPTVEIGVSIEGIFEESRETVSIYLARQLLGDGKLLLSSTANRSSAQILFAPA